MNILFQVIGWVCLIEAVVFAISIIFGAVKYQIKAEHHMACALYFIVAVYCLK